MIGTGVAGAKDRHETVPQIFVYHAAMFLLNDAHGYSEKIIHHLHHVGWSGPACPLGPRTHIDKHDRDVLFDSAQSRVARQDLFGCASAHVQAKSLTQFFLVSELTNHVIEFAEQPAKLICSSGPHGTKIDIQISTRNRIDCDTQLIAWFGHEPGHHQRGEYAERYPDSADEDGKPSRIDRGR